MIEFFFDCSSPWTYLAFHNIQRLAAEFNAPIRWRPVLVGGIFNAVNPSVYATRENPVPRKRDYMLKDLQDWAREAGLRIVFPPRVFPVNSVKAMRACIVLDAQGKLVPFAREVFEAYWGRDEDISQDAVLAEICARVGVDAAPLFAAIAESKVKEQLKANTDEVMRRGAFGSPTIFVNGDDMYFGNDRLPLVRAALQRIADLAYLFEVPHALNGDGFTRAIGTPPTTPLDSSLQGLHMAPAGASGTVKLTRQDGA